MTADCWCLQIHINNITLDALKIGCQKCEKPRTLAKCDRQERIGKMFVCMFCTYPLLSYLGGVGVGGRGVGGHSEAAKNHLLALTHGHSVVEMGAGCHNASPNCV